MDKEELYQSITDFIRVRTDKQVMELEENESYRNTKISKDNIFNEICRDICYQDEKKIKKLEEFIDKSEILDSYYEVTYYLCGLIDGIKLLNLFAKIV